MKQATRTIRPVELEMLAAPLTIGLVLPAPQRNKVIKESLTSLWVCLPLSAMVPVYSCMLIQQDLHLVVSTGWRSLCPSCPGAVKSLIQAEIGVARKLPLAASQHLHCPAGSGGFHSAPAQPPAQRPLRRAWAPVPDSSPPPALLQPSSSPPPAPSNSLSWLRPAKQWSWNKSNIRSDVKFWSSKKEKSGKTVARDRPFHFYTDWPLRCHLW